MKKIVFIDVDGTLVLDDQSILESTVKACREAKENGHILFLCTGRSKAELYDNIMEIGFNGMICAGGGYAEADGEMLFHQKVTDEEVRHVVDYFNEHGIDFYIESNGGLYASEHCVENLLNRMQVEKKEDHVFTNALIEGQSLYRSDVNKVCFLQPEVPFEDIIHEFEDSFEVMQCTVPSFGKESGELAVKGVSKTKAILEVLKHYGMGQADTVAIGDGLNDKDMILYCNVGIAMGNAVEELKQAADYVTDDIEQDGLYHAFQKFHLSH